MPEVKQSVVDILKDTLKWLEPMEPKSDVSYIDLWHIKDFNTFRDGVQGCEVCAKGALVLAHLCELERPISDLTDSRLSVENQARNLVGYDNANLMEIAFERWGEYSLGREPTEVEARAYKFGCRISDDRIRLRAILENAIEHGGTFTP